MKSIPNFEEQAKAIVQKPDMGRAVIALRVSYERGWDDGVRAVEERDVKVLRRTIALFFASLPEGVEVDLPADTMQLINECAKEFADGND